MQVDLGKQLKKLTASSLLAAVFLAGCGSDNSDDFVVTTGGATTGTVTVTHPGGLARTNQDFENPGASSVPPGVDSFQFQFLDANGNPIYGPLELPVAESVEIPNVPLAARTVDIDYLRGGGFALFEDNEAIDWQGGVGSVNDPDPGAAPASTSRWTTSVDSSGVAHINVSVEGDQATEFLVKGVGYSPAPIGFSNKDGPSFGDVFWKTPGGFLDFSRVWKRDVENIRGDFNLVRTYSMIAHFINDDGSIPPPSEFEKPDSLRVRTHEDFLDACWNNGDQPIYVIVGIPMPASIYIKSLFENPNLAAENRYWDDNFTATVEQMGAHPAVIGFTIFNEIGGTPDYSGEADKATLYWSQVQKYSERAKSIAPDKLVGWAFNDDPVFASSTIEYRRQYAGAVDFYGVNAFQAQQIGSTVDPWSASLQGDTARPIILTEYGLPATSHTNSSTIQPYLEPLLSMAKQIIAQRESVPVNQVLPETGDPNLVFPSEENALSIFENESTVAAAAESVGNIIPQLFQTPIVGGVVYFEWSDEWWKQDPYAPFNIPDTASPDPNARKSTNFVQLQITRQEGGGSNAGFPNGFYDEEGFGLNSIALDGRLATQVYTDNLGGRGGNLQVDRLTPRTVLYDTVVGVYQRAEQIRADALQ